MLAFALVMAFKFIPWLIRGREDLRPGADADWYEATVSWLFIGAMIVGVILWMALGSGALYAAIVS